MMGTLFASLVKVGRVIHELPVVPLRVAPPSALTGLLINNWIYNVPAGIADPIEKVSDIGKVTEFSNDMV